MTDATIPVEFITPEGARTFANYLRSTIKIRQGVLFEKRVDYFKGKRLVDTILEQHGKWPKTLPKVTDRAVAIAIGEHFLMHETSFFVRADRVDKDKGILMPSKNNVFESNGYYVWIYSGSVMFSHIAIVVMIIVIIAFTLLPLWPMVARKALWYLSVTFLLCFSGFCAIRLALFLMLWMVGIEFWIFPNMFDESLSVVDSFKPVYSIHQSGPGMLFYRLGTMIGLVAFGYWAYTQPTDFDELMAAQKGFVDDLYAGKLLPDSTQSTKDGMAYGGANMRSSNPGQQNFYQRNMPKLEEILAEEEDEEEEEEGFGDNKEKSEDAEKLRAEEARAVEEAAAEAEAEQDVADLMDRIMAEEAAAAAQEEEEEDDE